MKEHPILFGGEMVRAILDGRKIQTRRPVKPQPLGGHYVSMADDGIWTVLTEVGWGGDFACNEIGRCPYGVPSDHLWMRETWCDVRDLLGWDQPGGPPPEGRGCIAFKADGELRQYGLMLSPPEDFRVADMHRKDEIRWRPSIHMPRWASRITLEVTGVRVERVQEITDADAWDEGAWWWRYNDAVGPPLYIRDGECIECFRELWDAIYAKRGLGWDANPWVWIVEFRPLSSGDSVEEA